MLRTARARKKDLIPLHSLLPQLPLLPKESPASRRTTNTKKESIVIQSCNVNFFLKKTPIFPLSHSFLLSFPDERRHMRNKTKRKGQKKIQKRHEVMGPMDRKTHEALFSFDRLEMHQSRQSLPNFSCLSSRSVTATTILHQQSPSPPLEHRDQVSESPASAVRRP